MVGTRVMPPLQDKPGQQESAPSRTTVGVQVMAPLPGRLRQRGMNCSGRYIRHTQQTLVRKTQRPSSLGDPAGQSHKLRRDFTPHTHVFSKALQTCNYPQSALQSTHSQ